MNKDIEVIGTWEEYLAAAKVMVAWTELIGDAEGVIFGTAVVRGRVTLSAETEDVGARVEFITLATLFEASVALNPENEGATS